MEEPRRIALVLAVILLVKMAIRRATARPWRSNSGRFLDREKIPRMRILLVEDHQESRKDLQRFIERRGHEVVAVDSAEEAKQAIAAQAFPFLILDWMLPGKSGIELCRELRAKPDRKRVE